MELNCTAIFKVIKLRACIDNMYHSYSPPRFHQVCSNGLLSFGTSFHKYMPYAFPIYGVKIIAPFWADTDRRLSIGNGGHIWFRESYDPELLEIARQDIQKVLGDVNGNLIVDWLFIATWEKVRWFGWNSGVSNDYVGITHVYYEWQCEK